MDDDANLETPEFDEEAAKAAIFGDDDAANDDAAAGADADGGGDGEPDTSAESADADQDGGDGDDQGGDGDGSADGDGDGDPADGGDGDAADGDGEADKDKDATDDDPLAPPEGISERAKERFETLANNNRELTERVQQVEAQTRDISQFVVDHFAGQEQFMQVADLVKSYNSDDPSSIREAVKQLDQLRRDALLKLPDVADRDIESILEDETLADIKTRYEYGELTETQALEAARKRRNQNQQAQQPAPEQQAQQQQQQYEQAVQQATLDTAALIRGELSRDPAYQHKLKYMQEQQVEWLSPTTGQMMRGTPSQQIQDQYQHRPDLWPNALKQYWQTIPAPRSAPRKLDNQPLPSGRTATGKDVPKTLREAMFGD